MNKITPDNIVQATVNDKAYSVLLHYYSYDIRRVLVKIGHVSGAFENIKMLN